MVYNPIKNIIKGNFSLQEDINQTIERFDKFYKKIGLEKLIRKTESKLGTLDEITRRQVGFAYLSGTVTEILALGCLASYGPGDATYLAFCGAAMYGLGALHHNRMSQEYQVLKQSLSN